MQLVHVVEGGERAQMSKRRGEFVTLDELIDDIGVDAARFFMLQRSHDTRSTSTSSWRAPSHTTTPSTTSSTRTPGSPASSARRATSAARPRSPTPGGAARRRGGARRAGADQAPARAARRGRARRRSGARRTASAPTRPRPRPTSTPSTATARWSAPRARGSRRPGSRSAWPPARDRRTLDLLGSARRSGCSGRRPRWSSARPASRGPTSSMPRRGRDSTWPPRPALAASLTSSCDLLDPQSIRRRRSRSRQSGRRRQPRRRGVGWAQLGGPRGDLRRECDRRGQPAFGLSRSRGSTRSPCRLRLFGRGLRRDARKSVCAADRERTRFEPINPYEERARRRWRLSARAVRAQPRHADRGHAFLQPPGPRAVGRLRGLELRTPDRCRRGLRGAKRLELRTGDLSAERDFTDVRDVARAYTFALEQRADRSLQRMHRSGPCG